MTNYIEIIKSRLDPYRFHHSLCVADCAKKLAAKYGCNEDKAYTAGILHDIMKNAPPDEQLEFLEKQNVELSPVEKSNSKLYHAISGAYYIKNIIKIDDEDIFNAVRYHTTGRANMSLLEKVIFIADFVSDDRDYNGIEEIRQAAWESLEKAMMIGLDFTIKEIVGRRQTLHPDSINLYNELILEGQK